MSADPSTHPLGGAAARRAARNAAAIAAARILSSGALFVWQLILGRLLGAAEFGIYGTIGALYAIGAAIVTFGMSLIIIRDIARAPEQAGRYLTAGLVMQTGLALLAYLALNGTALALGYDEALRALTAIACLSLFLDLAGNLAYDQLLAQERMVTTSLVEVGHVIARIAAAALALAAGWGLPGVYLATLAAGFGRSALLWALLRGTGVRPIWPLDRAIARALLINSAPLALAAFINMTYAQVDKLMTTSLLGEAATGQLNAAFVIIVGVVELLSTTVLVALYPLMSRAYRAGGENAAFFFMVEKLAFFTLLIGLPLGLAFSLHAPAIIALFGPAFEPAAVVLRVLIWYAAATMIVNVFAQGLMVQNRQRRYVAVRTAGLVGKLLLNLILLPRIGVVGAAAASVLAEVGVLIALSGLYPVDWRARLPRLLRLGAAATVAGLAMAAFGAFGALAGLVGGLAVFAGAALVGRVLAPDEWDLLYRLTAAAPGGSFVLRYWRRDTPINW